MMRVLVSCRGCHGGSDGSRADCIPEIKMVVEMGGVAYMLYAEHVREKVQAMGYMVIKRYSDNEIPIGMDIVSKKTLINNPEII